MSFRQDPPRWSDDPTGTPASLLKALKAAQKYQPGAVDLAHMESTLELGLRLSIPPDLAASSMAPQASTPGGSSIVGRLAVVAAKGAGVLAVGSALIWGGTQLSTRGAPRPLTPPRTEQVFVPQASPAEIPKSDLQAPIGPALGATDRSIEKVDERRRGSDAAWPRAKQAPRSVSSRSRAEKITAGERAGVAEQGATPREREAPAVEAPVAVAVPQRAPATEVEPSEAEVLLAARRSLVADPGAALAAVNQHERRFPSGKLIEEREVLAIEALRNLGRTAEMEARSERFRARYPASIHGRSVKGPASGQGSPNGLASSSSAPH
jgi:hypothetical protein